MEVKFCDHGIGSLYGYIKFAIFWLSREVGLFKRIADSEYEWVELCFLIFNIDQQGCPVTTSGKIRQNPWSTTVMIQTLSKL